MPTLLDDRLVADALTALTGWSGDAQRIRRTVALSAEQGDQLVREVREAADAMNHHPEVNRTEHEITFVLWTHSVGGVSEYDIALASRIDDLVTRAAGTGPGAGVPDGEGTSA